MTAPKNVILTSLHGRRVGLNVEGDLVVAGKVVTNVTSEVGALVASLNITEELVDGPVRKVKLTCVAMPLVLTDESGVTVWSGTKIYDFPAGMLLFLGANIVGELTGVEVNATFVGDVALGTATADNTATPMVTVQQDLLQNTAVAAATAKVAPVDAVSVATALTESGARWHDGRATAKDMHLNFLIDEDGANATSTGLFTGTIEFAYIILGAVDPT